MNTFKSLFALLFLFPFFAFGVDDPDLPKYVLAILSRDTYDGEDVESDGEEDAEFGEDFLAQNEQQLAAGLEGTYSLYPGIPLSLEEVPAGAVVSQRIRRQAIRIAEEAFGRSAAESIANAQARMKIVVLSNRIKSMSRSRRYAGDAQNTAPVRVPTGANANIEVVELHHHLVPSWREWTVGHVHRRTDVEKVSRFFRALKRYEQSHGIDINAPGSGARQFRKRIEGNIRELVPFHSLRNALKNHQQTINFVRQFYQAAPNSPVYVGLFDDDFGTLRLSEQGLFSSYDALVQEQNARNRPRPTIMSTGYRFSSRRDIAPISSEIDRQVRIATALDVPNGPCYPEPNFMMLAQVRPNQRKVILADFNSKKDGKVKTETREFIQEAYAKGDASPQTTHFLNSDPLLTETPPRVSKMINESGLSEAFSQTGRLVNWGEPEIKFLRDMPQSHIMPRDWAQGVVAAFGLSTQISSGYFALQGPDFVSGRGINSHSLAISAVSRLFNAYHPIAPAFTDQLKKRRTKDAFRAALLAHLLDYSAYRPTLRPADVTAGRSNNARYLAAIQSANNLLTLRAMLAAIFVDGPRTLFLIEEAARRVGQAIRDGILNHFEFHADPRLSAARELSPYHHRDLMQYCYSERDVRRLLLLGLGYAADLNDPNDVLIVGDNRMLFPPVGAFREQSALEVFGQLLENHLYANPQDQIIGIPLNLGAHWVAVVVRLATARDRTQHVDVEYIDSLEPDPITVENLREVVQPVLDSILEGAELTVQASHRRRQSDASACGAMAVENLLDALAHGRLYFTPVMSPQATLHLRQQHERALGANRLTLDHEGPILLPQASAAASLL